MNYTSSFAEMTKEIEDWIKRGLPFFAHDMPIQSP